MKSKAIYFVGSRKVEVRDIEVGPPKPDEVQVEVRANGICQADVAFFTGKEVREYPFVAGHEGVGVVTQVGSAVEGFSPGDVVACGRNTFASVVNCPHQFVAKIPLPVNDFSLWIVEPVACVVNGLRYFGVSPGDRVVLIGAGFMGLMILQGLNRSLASEVIAVDIDSERLRMAERFGATEAIDVNSGVGEDRLEGLKREKADVVIEAAGTPQALDLATEITRTAGRLCIFSWHHERRAVDLSRWHIGGFEVLNTSPMIDWDRGFFKNFPRAIALMKKGVFDLKPLITHISPCERAQELFEIAADRREGYIKGVVTF
ncbi:MAG: zinc-dependent alcohol dehydrogenase [bacterium]